LPAFLFVRCMSVQNREDASMRNTGLRNVGVAGVLATAGLIGWRAGTGIGSLDVAVQHGNPDVVRVNYSGPSVDRLDVSFVSNDPKIKAVWSETSKEGSANCTYLPDPKSDGQLWRCDNVKADSVLTFAGKLIGVKWHVTSVSNNNELPSASGINGP
jgi:hypothetical protein